MHLTIGKMSNRETHVLSGSVQVAPLTSQTKSYLIHSAIAFSVTANDIDHAIAGQMVTKVIYLPKAEDAEIAIAGVASMFSEQLDPGVDPVTAAKQRGIVLAVLRLGNRDPVTEMQLPSPGDNAGNGRTES